jgi:hypothetical protein
LEKLNQVCGLVSAEIALIQMRLNPNSLIRPDLPIEVRRQLLAGGVYIP